MSYQPPSWKSTTALPFQLTVTTRPTMPAKRFSSGRSGLTSTILVGPLASQRFQPRVAGVHEIAPRLDVASAFWPDLAACRLESLTSEEI